MTSLEYLKGFRAAIRTLIELAEQTTDKNAKVVNKNTIQWLRLCHDNADKLSEGRILSLWMKPDGKTLFFKEE